MDAKQRLRKMLLDSELYGDAPITDADIDAARPRELLAFDRAFAEPGMGGGSIVGAAASAAAIPILKAYMGQGIAAGNPGDDTLGHIIDRNKKQVRVYDKKKASDMVNMPIDEFEALPESDEKAKARQLRIRR